MRFITNLGLICGLAGAVLLVVWHGAGTVLALLASFGWGLLLLPLAWLPHLVISSVSWRLLFPTGLAPRFHRVLGTLWIGGAVNTLLPVATVGGEVVKTRILTFDSRNGVHISASVTVDLTVQALSLLLWSMVGIVALVTLGAEGTLAAAAIAGTVLLGLGIAGFVWVQRGGAFGFLARLTPNTGLAETAVTVDAAIGDLYRQPGRIILVTLIRFIGRLSLTGELWLAAWIMGFPVRILEALMLKSLTVALRGAAFPVPGGLGVQEGSYVVLGALAGYPPDVMLKPVPGDQGPRTAGQPTRTVGLAA